MKIEVRRYGWATGAAVALILAAPCAWSADGAPVALRWTVPASCPDASHVTREVDRILGDGSPRPAVPLDVSATVTGDAGEFKVHLETQGESGTHTRDIWGTSCAVVADATALLIALIVDPDAISRPPPTASSPAPTSLPPAPPPPVPPPPASPSAPAEASQPAPSPPEPSPSPSPPVPVFTPSSPSPPAPPEAPAAAAPPAAAPLPDAGPARIGRPPLRVVLWAGGDAGSLPGISFTVGGRVVAMVAGFRLELGGGVWLERRATVAQMPSAGGEVGLATGSAGACRSLLRPGKLELGPCVDFELGRLHAEGFGATTQGSGSALWTALQGGALFAWAPVPSIAAVARLDAAVPFARPTFVIDGLSPVYRSSPVVGRATTGVEIRF